MTALEWAGVAVLMVGAVGLFFAQTHDVRARANRAPDADPKSFVIRPLHLLDSELYTAEGDRHRSMALRYLAVFLLCSLVAFVLFTT